MKACVFTLGCKFNEVESASLMRGLEEMGYEVTDTLCEADLYLLNTCAVTAEAEKKSRQAVARLRKFNPSAPVIVFGCAAENAPQTFASREGVTAVSGAMHKDKVLSLLGEKGIFREEEKTFCELPFPKRNRTRAFLRVQDGCNRFCSYCLIPYLRGRSRSRGMDSILQEAQSCEAKEIVLTGVDLSSYCDGDEGLAALLRRLSSVPARIRLGSLELAAVTDGLLFSAHEMGNFAPHFHICLQSGSDSVLRAMNRKYTRKEYLEACERVYRLFPNAAITTDIIVGFPGETEEDFAQSLSIVEEAGLARVHAFPFSARKGTAAFRMEDLPFSLKRERMARMEEVCHRAEACYLGRFVGEEAVAIFEEKGGYTENYIKVRAEGEEEGRVCRVRLTKREKGFMKAEIIEEVSNGKLCIL